MHQALKEAHKAFDEDEVPVGAVIMLNDKIISRGYNQVEKLSDATAHAEIIALTAAFNFLGSKYLPKATIFITIEPCLMCAGALFWSKIARIVYGADDDKHGYKKYFPEDQKGSIPFHPATQISNGLLKQECSQLIKAFFVAKRNKREG